MVSAMSAIEAELITTIHRIEYDPARKLGRVLMPPGCCVDMSGTIALFERIDPTSSTSRRSQATKPTRLITRQRPMALVRCSRRVVVEARCRLNAAGRRKSSRALA